MPRSLPSIVAASLLAFACGDDGSGDDDNPFGDPTVATTDVATDPPATSDAMTSGDATAATGAATGEATTADPPGTTDDGNPTSPPGTDSGDGSGDPSGPPPGDGQLGECVGTGAWDSCAQYCEAVGDSCVEQGCDGNTAVYYNDVGACVAMRADSFETGSCTDGFAMGGGISFARCCCA